MDVHHVTGFIIAHADIVVQALVQAEMVEGVLGGEVGRGEVEIAVGHEDFQVRVVGHCVAQCFGDIDIPVFMVCVRPRPILSR